MPEFIWSQLIRRFQTNCITEVIFNDALAQARELDGVFKETGKLIGPLHGVPVTVKDQFNVKGYDSTIGYVGRSFSPASEDAVLVQILKKMGAVILAKTNLPQSIMVCLFSWRYTVSQV
jgi:Asp-tRNA(Asn)/Glu-tRNA(Gln) amidotransferase A subunit family amidase